MGRLTSMTVLPMAENLTDHHGFTVLSQFRTLVVENHL
jgi:hypothetical protein